MDTQERLHRLTEAASEFEQHLQRDDGMRVATSLADGLNTLRELFFTRVQIDVEQAFGVDSMLVPASLAKTAATARTEIDVYLVAESAAYVGDNKLLGDLPGKSFDAADEWYSQWLRKLRLGGGVVDTGAVQRLAYYGRKSADDRRRAFSVVLERVVPEARRAPLIVYRLLPGAVAVATALSLGDHVRAAESRRQQVHLLACITDCRTCRGSVLENGEKCPECGNPFWKYDWLTAE